MSATSEELAAQAEQLQASIGFFRIEHVEHRSAQSAPVPRPAAKPQKAARAAPRRTNGAKPHGQAGDRAVLDLVGSEDERDSDFVRY
jgi:methyl-accepting chemotaxis protein